MTLDRSRRAPRSPPAPPRALFPLAGYRGARNRQQYDVAPDAQHFIMIREPSSNAPASVIDAERWLEDLKARRKARQ